MSDRRGFLFKNNPDFAAECSRKGKVARWGEYDPSVTEKLCARCNKILPIEAFQLSNSSGRRDGRQSYCRPCVTEYKRAWSRAHPENITARWKRAKERNPNVSRERVLRKYGLTLDSFEALFQKQKGKCRGCLSPLIRGRATHIDHCHNSNKIRGLLCNNCNLAVGMLSDDPTRMRRLARYVSEAK
jgi:hypothetical protein